MSKIGPDVPGMSAQDDRYDWCTTFIPMLAKITREWPPREGLTFGIYGPWGSGKSTILNFLETQFNKRTADKDRNTYVVRFNPWFFDNPQALVMAFFASMGAALDTNNSMGKWEDAGKLMKKMGTFLSVASKGVSFLGMSFDLGAIADAAKEAGGELASAGEQSLQKTRADLAKELNKLGDAGGRIMVLIDDVDRLDSQELFTLLRLIRTVADLPSITLLVAMDEHRVTAVLNAAAKRGYGRAYLEKIVQAHVHVPVAAPSVMEEQLVNGITEIFHAARLDSPVFTLGPNGYVPSIRALNPIIRTPRDLARYLNGLRILTLTRERWDLDAGDAIHLAALQVFYPEVYDRVRRSKALLTARKGEFDGHAAHVKWLVMGDSDKDPLDPYSKGAAELVRTMFGNVNGPNNDTYDPTLAERRIASPEIFDAYFAFHAELKWVPRETVRKWVHQLFEAAGSEDTRRFLDVLDGITPDQGVLNDSNRSDVIAVFSSFPAEEMVRFANFFLDTLELTEGEHWKALWIPYMALVHRRIRENSPDFDAIQFSQPVGRWINSNPNEEIRKARIALYNRCDAYR